MTQSRVRTWQRHLVIVIAGLALVWLFWMSRPQWSADMRLWKAIGDASLMLLVVTMMLGPLARLWKPAGRLLPWRRETGVWFGILALVHTILILNGWARWSLTGFFGYEFVPQLGRTARMEPGFGLSNLLGLLAMIWTLILVATSTDWAVRKLGPRAWKWLHNATHTVFWLVTAHVAYFLFIHYTLSFHREPLPTDWFQLPFLGLAGTVVLLQLAAFVVTTRRHRRGQSRTPLMRSAEM